MEERLRFVAEYLDGVATMTELAEEYGISRETGRPDRSAAPTPTTRSSWTPTRRHRGTQRVVDDRLQRAISDRGPALVLSAHVDR